MERNAILAIAFSLLILLLWNELVIKKYSPAPLPTPEAATGPAGAPPREVAEGAGPPVAGAPPAEATGAVAALPVREETTTGGRDITVETDLYRAVFTTAGARLKSLQLKKYRAHVAADSPPQDLVPHEAGAPLPLGVVLRGPATPTDGAVVSQSDGAVVYRIDRDRLELSADQEGVLEFVGDLDGTTIRKRIALHGGKYLWHLEVEALSVAASYSELAVAWDGPLEVGTSGFHSRAAERPFDAVLALQANKLQRRADTDLEQAPELLENDIAWAGLSGQYFFVGLIPSDDAETAAARLWATSSGANARLLMLLPPGTFTASFEVYTGPKDIALLEESGHSLRRAVDLGWFTFVALPMLQFLRFLHRITGNFGVGIILLTVLIKVLFFPLTQKSMRSMKQMQKLQPEMQRVREQYKDKPDEMNRAVMDLYKRHQVNPLGGCLPMLLQLPVFFGLYQALLNAVELRHAPFAGWITDLSAPDRLGTMQLPYVDGAGFPVMTLIMGASMLIQQWMTPSTAADPMQQKMMMFMPIIFTFMFINFPAGLTLYWLVNNILTIAQQYYLNREAD